MAYVVHPDGETVSSEWLAGAGWETDIGGRRVPISVSLRPWYRAGA